MRLESAGDDRTKVWLTDSDIDDLRRAAASQRDDILLQLGAYVGLRAFEIPQVQPQHISDTGEGYRLRVPKGKDTTGNGGKPRDAYLPATVERDLQRFQNSQNIAPKDPFIELSTRSVRKVVSRTADAAADQTGDSDFERVSSHDLRRRYAQRLLVDQDMNPRVVMEVGGWSSFGAIEPYLNAPSETVIDEEFAGVDVV
jgi:integrase